MIKVMNLSYRIKKFSMENVNFALEDGYLMTLLGKNGAGKTTLLNLIYGCLEPTTGMVFWNGADVTGKHAMESKNGDLLYHEEVAYVGNRKWCVESLNCNENVSMFKGLYSNWDEERFEKILKLMEFSEDDLSTKVEELSSGKAMQFQLAFALARHPRLLLLDEPMANLDPVVKTDLWDLLLRTISGENISIIISTHLVEEVNQITDYIGVIENGKLVKFGDREQVLGEALQDGDHTEGLRGLLEVKYERANR